MRELDVERFLDPSIRVNPGKNYSFTVARQFHQHILHGNGKPAGGITAVDCPTLTRCQDLPGTGAAKPRLLWGRGRLRERDRLPCRTTAHANDRRKTVSSHNCFAYSTSSSH